MSSSILPAIITVNLLFQYVEPNRYANQFCSCCDDILDENSVISELSFSNDHEKNKVYPNKHRVRKSKKEKENARQ